MRILHILDHSIPLHSGYTFRTRAILDQQRILGWETNHITSPKHNQAIQPQCTEEEINGLHFFRTSPSKGFISQLPFISQWAVATALEQRLRSVIEQIRPDILHAHSPALNGLAAIRAGKRYKLPVVYEVRAFWEDAAVDHGTSKEWGLRYRLTRALETHVLKKADAVTTICEGLRGEIISRGIPSDNVVVIPNAVDLEKFVLSDSFDMQLSERLNLKGKSVIGFIGSFYAYEGLTLLLQSLPNILNQNPNIRLLLVGGGPQESILKNLAQTLNLMDKIVFIGRVPHDQIQHYYDLVDIFVYPRLPMRLTNLVTPLKPLEAMARGRLVVASDVGGHRELINSGENGILFKAGDSQALARCIIELLMNRKDWSTMSHAARYYVETERSWPQCVARYETVYSKILAI